MASFLAAGDIPAIVGVVTGFGLVVIVPIVAMLLTHQRRMAELVHGQNTAKGAADERLARLESEVALLRQQVAENIIAVDDRRSISERLAPPPVPEQIRKL